MLGNICPGESMNCLLRAVDVKGGDAERSMFDSRRMRERRHVVVAGTVAMGVVREHYYYDHG